MRTRFRAATLAGLVAVTGALTGAAMAPAAAVAAPGGSCCIRTGDGPWFSGPTQVADCNAYGAAHVSPLWDGYHCTPGTGTYTGQTHLTFWLNIS